MFLLNEKLISNYFICYFTMKTKIYNFKKKNFFDLFNLIEAV